MQKFLIVGLGNPGKEYSHTRHNIGFRVLEDWLSNSNNVKPDCLCELKNDKKHYVKIANVKTSNKNILAIEPDTFMNKSGIAIKAIIDYYDIPLDNIIIVHDDLSFEFEKFKLSKNSGPAGHNGIKSIIEHLGNKNFARLRVGISSTMGSCPNNNMNRRTFVLNNFSEEEETTMNKLFQETTSILDYFLKTTFEETANNFNRNIKLVPK